MYVFSMRGRDLFEVIAQQGPLSEAEAKRHTGTVLKVIEYLNSLGITHRDLKVLFIYKQLILTYFNLF